MWEYALSTPNSMTTRIQQPGLFGLRFEEAFAIMFFFLFNKAWFNSQILETKQKQMVNETTIKNKDPLQSSYKNAEENEFYLISTFVKKASL